MHPPPIDHSTMTVAEPAMIAGVPVWVHGGIGGHVVLMCGATGSEGQTAYRTWCLLAHMLAARGLTAIRFDWPGEGDAADPLDDIPGIEAAMMTARRIFEALANRPGVTAVSVVGLRLGAPIAARALEGATVARMALLQPVSHGRRYRREMNAAARLVADASDGAGTIGGFAPDHMADAGLDALTLAPLPAAGAMLIATQGETAPDRCATTEQIDFDGYGAMMAPNAMTPPVALFGRVAAWLAETPAPQLAAPLALEAPVLTSTHWEETRLRFGPGDALAGVLTRPAVPAAGLPCVVMPNAGPNPHHGWGRMAVVHARALAQQGIACLRFDLGGLGDARMEEGSPRAAVYRQSHRSDLSAALDLVQTQGFGRIIVSGLCAGGNLAFHAAHDDQRIDGIIAVNVLKLLWKETDDLDRYEQDALQSASRYRAQALSGAGWRRLMSGEIGPEKVWRVIRMMAVNAGSALLSRLGMEPAPDADAARLRAMARAISQRGGRVTLAFAEGDASRDEAERHFGTNCRAIAGLPGIAIENLGPSDHELSNKKARDRLLNLTAEHALGLR